MELELVVDMTCTGLTPCVPDRFPVFNLAEDIMSLARWCRPSPNVMANYQ